MGSGVLPALTQDGMNKEESGRLVRVETQMFYVSKQIEALHTDLQNHMNEEAAAYIRQEVKSDAEKVRTNLLENRVGTLYTHLKWIYGIFGTFKASIVAWLIHKG